MTELTTLEDIKKALEEINKNGASIERRMNFDWGYIIYEGFHPKEIGLNPEARNELKEFLKQFYNQEEKLSEDVKIDKIYGVPVVVTDKVDLKMNYEEVLEEFIDVERKKMQMGSGDDMFYEQQIIDYVNKQRPFWIDFMKFIEKKLKGEQNDI